MAGGIEHTGAVASHGAERADDGVIAAPVNPPAGWLPQIVIGSIERIGRGCGILWRRRFGRRQLLGGSIRRRRRHWFAGRAIFGGSVDSGSFLRCRCELRSLLRHNRIGRGRLVNLFEDVCLSGHDWRWLRFLRRLHL